jgi:hypothetical protein
MMHNFNKNIIVMILTSSSSNVQEEQFCSPIGPVLPVSMRPNVANCLRICSKNFCRILLDYLIMALFGVIISLL